LRDTSLSGNTASTTDPDVDVTDLEPIDKMLADAQVVGLGESTHE
jgi:erythromycin esterase-like protein